MERKAREEPPGTFAGATGVGVRVAIVDSGVNPGHPAVIPVAKGIGLRWRGGAVERDDDSLDRIGHGTAVAAAVRAGAAEAEIVPIRIFRRTLTTRVDTLVEALDWAADQRFDLVNLSLGLGEGPWRSELETVCSKVVGAGALLVAAAERDGAPSLPGSLDAVIAVRADPGLDRFACRVEGGALVASPWAAELPDLPREANLHGPSFAVANATAWLARGAERLGRESLRARLADRGVLRGRD